MNYNFIEDKILGLVSSPNHLNLQYIRASPTFKKQPIIIIYHLEKYGLSKKQICITFK